MFPFNKVKLMQQCVKETPYFCDLCQTEQSQILFAVFFLRQWVFEIEFLLLL